MQFAFVTMVEISVNQINNNKLFPINIRHGLIAFVFVYFLETLVTKKKLSKFGLNTCFSFFLLQARGPVYSPWQVMHFPTKLLLQTCDMQMQHLWIQLQVCKGRTLFETWLEICLDNNQSWWWAVTKWASTFLFLSIFDDRIWHCLEKLILLSMSLVLV